MISFIDFSDKISIFFKKMKKISISFIKTHLLIIVSGVVKWSENQ